VYDVSAETMAADVSDAETELIVAEVDERRPVRIGETRPHIDKTDAYNALIEQLDQLPLLDGEVTVLATTPAVEGPYSCFLARG